MSDLENEVRTHIYSVLDGSCSITDFEDWFVGHTWDERPPLVSEVDLLLAEKDFVGPEAVARQLAQLVMTTRLGDVPADDAVSLL